MYNKGSYSWLHIRIIRSFKNYGCLELTSRDNDLIGLEWGLGRDILLSSPRDFGVRPELRATNTDAFHNRK